MNTSRLFWDGMADGYDDHMGGYGESRIRTVEHIRKYLHPEDMVLDFGCGTGSLAVEIAGRVKAVRGIDLSSKMIRAAKRKAGENACTNAEFFQSTIFDKRWRGESFDAVVAAGILHLLGNPSRAVRRIHELLKPGGWFLSSTPCRIEDSLPLALISNSALVLGRIGISPMMRFFRISELERVVSGGGFRIVEAATIPFGSFEDPAYVFARFLAARKA
ncbi:MAG: class I SAM-dependent methyltransferase [Anaerolineales bacterium]|nr:class I SAM-dependent methyltransferase [Anaerolineales bacterium]